jgi:hypothetical protein
MNKTFLARFENRPQRDNSVALKKSSSSNQATAWTNYHLHQQAHNAVVTENRNPIPATARFMATQRRNTSNLLETDPNCNEQHALFNSSRGPPKKRLSPKTSHRADNKENIFAFQQHVAPQSRGPPKKRLSPKMSHRADNKENILALQPHVAPHPYMNFLTINSLRAPAPPDIRSYSCAPTFYPNQNVPNSMGRGPQQPPDTRSYSYQPAFYTCRNIDYIPRSMANVPHQRNGGYDHRASINAEGPRVPPQRQKSPVPCFRGNISPVPPPIRYSNQANSDYRAATMPAAPLILRSCSSTCCEYSHHAIVPPQLKLSVSKGQQLISGPIMQTPDSLSVATPRLFTTASSGSTASMMGFHNFTPNVAVCSHLIAASHPFVSQNDSFRANYSNQAATNAPASYQSDFRKNGHSKVDPGKNVLDLTKGQSNDPTVHNKKRKSKKKDLFDNVPFTDRPCKCRSSRCLKLYCECFGNGRLCNSRLCSCTDCSNTEAHKVKHGDREIAIKRILARRPNAFDKRVHKRTGESCGCKKSG